MQLMNRYLKYLSPYELIILYINKGVHIYKIAKKTAGTTASLRLF